MIVIPMAGMSSRFFKAGYTKPKYMLDAHGETLFDHSVKSFQAYFSTLPFLFIVRNVYETEAFVKQRAQELGIKEFYIVVLDQETRGQAETVALGLELLEQQRPDYQGAITVFNIDTFRPNFAFPDVSHSGDGYLEVFKGSGDNWSFALPEKAGSTKVIKTTEKNPISDLCSTGLYHFNRKQAYLDAYQAYVAKPQQEWEKGELYIAPLYNLLIEQGLEVHYHLIERNEVIFCGVPQEYTDFLNR
ncbi:glycosyltransferase family 2 protein [Vibrio sinaloensis]|uniref:glycosyltransferase family 2 protein n=1 Tax=Photobacterium sp. (strain ATCC 43367) TaxID=379097 RepID=UPI0020579AAD|nr:glycosyltransferase family 2 protein [Vibrio sinaloensis]UPQ88092.1 glycosyltransferase family 2 protein [Vibrio sinaloensis]